ncbi:MAG: alpha/beta hydrolase [Pseudomonadota bacterium]|nr:alpha/beta hydrolase [Pseudomonadota bacterium]
MSRKIRIILALLIVVGALGYRYFAQRADGDRAATTRSSPAAEVTPPAAPTKLGSLSFKACSLDSPFASDAIEAHCTMLSVPENPAAPNGRKIALNIAWLPATNDAEVEPDPIFFLAGGPGQAAVATYPQLDAAFKEARKHRHVILVDQRGTGESNPLNCKSGDDAVEPTPELAAQQATTCSNALGKRADLRYYTTTDAVRDLDSVRKSIGAAHINLVGVSYGTRVAQQYAMRHPSTTRSIVLDSVAPNALYLGGIFARNLDDALVLQFGRCTRDAACKTKLGDPRTQLDSLIAKLEADPPLVSYRDATTGAVREERLEPAHVIGLVRMYAYMPMAAALLPIMIDDANRGHYEGLMSLSKMLTSELEEAMAMGMQLSVLCTEDGSQMRADPNGVGTLLGNNLVDFLAAQCNVWPKGNAPADFHAPLATKVPALLMSGEYDPVTPPRYGDDVVKHLPNGRHLVLRGQGHNVIGAGCMPKLLAQFLDNVDAKALDAKCLDTLAYVPPFTSFNGWEP